MNLPRILSNWRARREAARYLELSRLSAQFGDWDSAYRYKDQADALTAGTETPGLDA